MKTFLCFTSFFLLNFIPLLAQQAEQGEELAKLKHPIKPILWKIEGKELTKPSYMLGTLHIGDPRVVTLHPSAEKAFKSADTFAAESNLDPEQQVTALAQMIRKDGSTLTNEIGPDLTKELNTELSHINKEFNATTLNELKTWSVAMLIPQLEEALLNRSFLDQVLWNRAKKSNKEIWVLEPEDMQFKFLNALDSKSQASCLKDTLAEMKAYRENKTSIHDELLELYLKGDSNKISRTLENYNERASDKNSNQKVMEALLLKRNVTMCNSIIKKLTESKDQSHFIAAGTAHFVGNGSVLELLGKQGYTITRISE